MKNFEKITGKVIWCKNCDNPIISKDKKCSKCGMNLNFKMKINKKHFNPIKFAEFQGV
jgi:hypothetical protein